MNFFNKVYEVVKQIPYGKVMTYGTIAKIIGNPNMSRQVGWALHSNPDLENIPCHRVVDRYGNPSKAFAFGGENRQIELLKREGVEFYQGKVKRDFFIY
ncbi:MAG: MGMT family protein [Bacillota bacterium]|jgi:methylated-DNA-protein-cysteine methyltransferase-like protein|nr:MGMT family protein [Bacillota bacterium]HHU43291.1 MGMT family protein [Clostridiales bacterium]